MTCKEQIYNKAYYRGRASNYIFWYTNLRFKPFWLRRIRTLKRFVKQGKLLDVGCAFGFFTKFLEKDFEVFGVDIAEYAIERARRLASSPERLQVFDIQKGVPFKGKFDAITAFDIMEHIVSPLAVFENLYAMLARHGYLYIEMPLSNTLINCDIGHHYRPLGEWVALLKEAGFETRLTQTYYTVGLRAVMIPNKKVVNYCSIIAHKLD